MTIVFQRGLFGIPLVLVSVLALRFGGEICLTKRAHYQVMTTTPLWVPLVIAGLAILGTIGGTVAGVLITERRSDRREETNWNRERDRERQRWQREDEARTFDHRRVAYSDFYESLRSMARRVYDYGMGLSLNDEGELPFDWQLPTFDRLQHLQLYATPSVAEAASDAYSAAWKWGHEASPGVDDAEFYRRQDEYNVAEIKLLALIREALSIPDT